MLGVWGLTPNSCKNELEREPTVSSSFTNALERFANCLAWTAIPTLRIRAGPRSLRSLRDDALVCARFRMTSQAWRQRAGNGLAAWCHPLLVAEPSLLRLE